MKVASEVDRARTQRKRSELLSALSHEARFIFSRFFFRRKNKKQPLSRLSLFSLSRASGSPPSLETMKPSRRGSGPLASPILLLCCLALLALTHLVNVTDARFIVEKAGLRVRFPPEARKLGPISMALGNFGRAFYAGSLT